MNKAANNMLVTGASGFVGQRLCAAGDKRGWHIKAALRMPDSTRNELESVVVGQIDSQTDWAESLREVDVVIHLAARVHVMREESNNPLEEFRRANVAGTERLARSAALCGVKRLVYVSSIKVNGEATYGSDIIDETNAAAPRDPYGISKWEAEQVLHRVAAETGLEIVIIRPPLVYGPEVKGNFAQMLRVLAKRVPLPLASIHNLRSLIYLDNLVDSLLVCANHPAAAGQTYLVSDGEDISTPDLLSRLGAEMKRPARLIRCPPALLKWLGRLSRKQDQLDRLLDSLRVDSGKIRRELNWTPPYTLQQGLQKTAEWYRDAHL